MIENIVEVGGLLMHDDIETYRNRFSPDIGPSWNLMNYIFDHISSIFPAILVKDRTIPLELDSSQKFLRKDLLYRDGDWLLPFGVRSYIYTQYFSKTYEKLRKDMETKGIKLYDNKRYDMDISKKA
ncbi:unnamed protein product [Rhizophagus irregularis]|nr:unnamed protein product [Rhizophagus irregularis]